MLIVNRSNYPTATVGGLLRYALLETEEYGSVTVEVDDLAEEGSPAHVEIELFSRVWAGTASPRLLLAMASPVRFPAAILPGEIAARDWREAVVACCAYGARAVWRQHRYPAAGPSGEAIQDMYHFARWKLMGYRKLQEHARQWGWVPVERAGCHCHPGPPDPEGEAHPRLSEDELLVVTSQP